MSRPFGFKNPVQGQARLRQQCVCAVCSDQLDDLEEHAHHVFPNQSGNPRHPGHAWLSSMQNCVVLCAQCHEIVHDSARYARGAVAPPGYFEYSHGDNSAAHKAWVKQLGAMAKSLW